MDIHSYKDTKYCRHKRMRKHVLSYKFDDRQILSELEDNIIVQKFREKILSANTSFHEGFIESYFHTIDNINSFFDYLYDTEYDFLHLLPDIFNSDFLVSLIDAITSNSDNFDLIEQNLYVIAALSNSPDYVQFYRNSPLFSIVYNLLSTKHQFASVCLDIIKQYLVIFSTTKFPYNLKDFMILLKELYSIYQDDIESIGETVRLLVQYFDVTSALYNIYDLFQTIVKISKSNQILSNVFESLVILHFCDYSYKNAFDSGIMQIYIQERLEFFIYFEKKYAQSIYQFFNFIFESFKTIDEPSQKRTLAIFDFYKHDIETNVSSGLYLILLDVEDIQIKCLLYNIITLYIGKMEFESQNNMYLFSAIINNDFITEILKDFDDLPFELKKQTIFFIRKLLKSQNQELFRQLVDYGFNYVEICADFVNQSNDILIQKVYLESIIELLKISQKINSNHSFITDEVCEGFIDPLTSSEDQHLSELAIEVFNLITYE
ncbi:hypothetical protein TRFO_36361 [Tritrichomonas foetus]|uniref:Uncharacterized protein n=1 Tax=Tritrichomonas foetus TaxID=1144522 RepID=A0A1J4JGH9_9EUKA|nr:hypothetical protein TRFO_36361 [Tritrichomonas foetus]|eukprot:OHS97407.1 hypothetical protein TRFO_36361 [Tritrichomonas foetus]